MLTVRETDRGVAFRIRVLPRSSKCELAGLHGDALKIRITAPPVEGRANEECIRFLSSLFGVKRADIAIAAGRTSKNKRVTVAGLTPADVLRALPESPRHGE